MKEIFDYLIGKGWCKVDEEHLIWLPTEITANILKFPIEYVGFISKGGTISYRQALNLNDVDDCLKYLNQIGKL